LFDIPFCLIPAYLNLSKKYYKNNYKKPNKTQPSSSGRRLVGGKREEKWHMLNFNLN
jgi:hypothetical protein